MQRSHLAKAKLGLKKTRAMMETALSLDTDRSPHRSEEATFPGTGVGEE